MTNMWRDCFIGCKTLSKSIFIKIDIRYTELFILKKSHNYLPPWIWPLFSNACSLLFGRTWIVRLAGSDFGYSRSPSFWLLSSPLPLILIITMLVPTKMLKRVLAPPVIPEELQALLVILVVTCHLLLKIMAPTQLFSSPLHCSSLFL